MKSLFCIVVALTVLVFGGCSHSENEVLLGENNYSLTIGMPEQPMVRTTLGEVTDGERVVYWSSGDCISANGVTSYEAQISGEKSKVATFNFAQTPTYPCDILYPASFYKDATTITLPKEQAVAVGSFATNTLPMAACVAEEGGYVSLNYLASVIHLQLKDVSGENEGKHADVLRVEFRGNNAEVISGDFVINYADATLVPAEGGVQNDFTVAHVKRTLSSTEIMDIFIVVPSREYANGFTIQVIDKVGHFMDKKARAIELERGKIYKMPLFEFVPTGSHVSVGIK